MPQKKPGKGKGTQFHKQLDALTETIGTNLMTIKACHAADRQGFANVAVTAILLQDAVERFERELESILKSA